MRCPHCLSRLSSLRVFDASVVAFVCEKCDRSLSPDVVLSESVKPSPRPLVPAKA